MLVLDAQPHTIPPGCLSKVLGAVPLQERLQHCALVCQDWCALVPTVTRSIHLKPTAAFKHDSLYRWLRRYGNNVNVLHLQWPPDLEGAPGWQSPSGDVGPAQQFVPTALANLQCLCISNVELRFKAAAAADDDDAPPSCGSGSAAAPTSSASLSQPSNKPWTKPPTQPWTALTALTSVELDTCRVTLGGLSACSRLQQLTLKQHQEPLLDSAPTADSGGDPEILARIRSSSVLGTELPGLVSLTSLHLAGDHWCPEALASVSCCTRLQQLQLPMLLTESPSYSVRLEKALLLPPSTTRLIVEVQGCEKIDTTTAPALASFGQLRELQLLGARGSEVGPAVVAALSHLTSLHMVDMPMSSPELAPELSLALKGMTALRVLNLRGLVWTDEGEGFTPDDVALLTAPPHLTLLDLSEWQLPEAARAGLFPADRVCPQLQQLSLGPTFLDSSTAVQALVKCCPNLHTLHMAAVTRKSVGHVWDWKDVEASVIRSVCLEGLCGAQQLTSLALTGVQLSTDADHGSSSSSDGSVAGSSSDAGGSIWQHVAAVTGLRQLSCKASDLQLELLPTLLHLTACRQLQEVDLSFKLQGKDLSIKCSHQAYDLLPSTGKPHYHNSPSVWWKLPAAVVQAVCSLCAEALTCAATQEPPAATSATVTAPAAVTAAAAAAADATSAQSEAQQQQLLTLSLQLCREAARCYWNMVRSLHAEVLAWLQAVFARYESGESDDRSVAGGTAALETLEGAEVALQAYAMVTRCSPQLVKGPAQLHSAVSGLREHMVAIRAAAAECNRAAGAVVGPVAGALAAPSGSSRGPAAAQSAPSAAAGPLREFEGRFQLLNTQQDAVNTCHAQFKALQDRLLPTAVQEGAQQAKEEAADVAVAAAAAAVAAQDAAAAAEAAAADAKNDSPAAVAAAAAAAVAAENAAVAAVAAAVAAEAAAVAAEAVAVAGQLAAVAAKEVAVAAEALAVAAVNNAVAKQNAL